MQSFTKDTREFLEKNLDKINLDCPTFIKTNLQRTIFNKLYKSSEDETFNLFFARLAANSSKNDEGHFVKLYQAMCRGDFTFATTVLRNLGVENRANQYSSCFLLEPDYTDYGSTIKSIYNIAKEGGGLGINLSRCPSSQSKIGYPGMQGVENHVQLIDALLYTSMQSEFRSGGATAYLEVWHADFMNFLQLKNPSMTDRRLRTCHLGIVLNDVFQEMILCNGTWHFFDGAAHSDLMDCYGSEFKERYAQLVKEGQSSGSMPARTILTEILTLLTKTGEPFVLFKDAINKCNFHEQYGVLSAANLCTEIVQYHNHKEYSACTLGSINLSNMVKENGNFDFHLLMETTALLVFGLNNILSNTKYSVGNINKEIRPIGIGVQGFADALVKMNMRYNEGGQTLATIFEHIYFAALTESNRLAELLNTRFYKFDESPYASGMFYFEKWNRVYNTRISLTLPWEELRAKIIKFGLINSLFIAQMPTATTALFMGNTEGCEPLGPAIERKKNSFGEFLIKSKHLDPSLHGQLFKCGGLVSRMCPLPENHDLYLSTLELSPEIYMDVMSKALPFIDQSVSLTLYLPDEEASEFNRISRWLFAAWRKGFKTGLYYCRMQPVSSAIDVSGIKNSECLAGLCCDV